MSEDFYKKCCLYFVFNTRDANLIQNPDGSILFTLDSDHITVYSYKALYDRLDIGEVILNAYDEDVEELYSFGITDEEIKWVREAEYAK